MTRRFTLNRRQLLAASGMLAGSLMLPSRRARAQTAPPKRLVIFFTQHGTVYDNWKMRPNGAPDDGTAFTADLGGLAESDFSTILQPLYPFREKLAVVDGLSMASAEADDLGNGHDIGTRHSLTGAFLVDGAAGGPSIDQVVAQQIRSPGRIDSLELAVIGALNGGAIWRGAGQSVPPDSSAQSVFNRVFPAQDGGTTITPDDLVRAAQPSVLDLVQNEYDLTSKRLTGLDGQKLAQHRDLVRAVQQRLLDLANIQCTRPSAPVIDNSDEAAAYESRASAMFSLTTAALACDLTRVVTIQMGQLGASQIGAPPGDVHAEYAHQVEVDETAKAFMTTYHNVHARQLAELLSLLDAVPEAGGTLLDSCAVVWCGELADGVHNYRPWPAVVAGGALGASGKYVRLPIATPNPSIATNFPNYVPTIGPPHNRFWVSVGQALGANVDTLGETTLTCPDGQTIDCTGPLEELG